MDKCRFCKRKGYMHQLRGTWEEVYSQVCPACGKVSLTNNKGEFLKDSKTRNLEVITVKKKRETNK